MIRNLKETDYEPIITKINVWWGGRDMVDMLPFLFFKHFGNTSFVFVDEGKLVGFVVGFVSVNDPKLAYIHFTGVDPEYRKTSIASSLYSTFRANMKLKGCVKIQCVTSPGNSTSLAYHHCMGFKATGYHSDGKPMHIENYDGPGNDRVLLTLDLST